MLLIGMPKSASTSLIATLGELTGLATMQGIARVQTDIDCEGFPELQKYHTNMIERSGLFIKQVVTGNKKIFKEHLLPTKRHLKHLEKYKAPIVVLLREVEHSVDCYKRHDANHYKKYKKHIDLKKIEKDLKKFHDTYLHWISVQPNIIYVYYKDLVKNYVPTIKKILKHYKLPISKNIKPLKRLKYTGIGVKRLNVTNSPAKECVNVPDVDNSGNAENTEKERTES
jgi:hypothetical protein